MRKIGYFILSSLLASTLMLTTLFADETGLQGDDFRPGVSDSPIFSGTPTELGGRDVTLSWKLPSPGL